MDYKVVYKETFLSDLEEVLKRMAAKNPETARRLGVAILRTSESLNSFPERFPRVRNRPGVRRFVQQKYFKVFYRVVHDLKTVEILRVWDGRRETDPAL